MTIVEALKTETATTLRCEAEAQRGIAAMGDDEAFGAIVEAEQANEVSSETYRRLVSLLDERRELRNHMIAATKLDAKLGMNRRIKELSAEIDQLMGCKAEAEKSCLKNKIVLDLIGSID